MRRMTLARSKSIKLTMMIQKSRKDCQRKSCTPPQLPLAKRCWSTIVPIYLFRSWCAHCVRGKAKANKHSITGGSEASDIPIVSFDYAFLSDRDGRAVVEGDEPRIVEDDLSSDDAVIKVLVARDSKSKMCTAIPVPQKELDPTEWSLRECLKFLELLGTRSSL